MKKRFFMLLGVLAFGLTSAQAEVAGSPRKYAVLSLIGDSLSIVTYQQSTGSNIDQNRRQAVKMPDQTFDYVVLGAVQDALARVDPTSTTALFSGTPQAYADQADLLDGQRLVAPAWLAATLQKEACTHLVLVVRQRAAAEFKTADSRLTANGSLSGIGFYVDGAMRTYRTDTGEDARGFIAPFLYVKIALFDVATSTLVAQKIVTESHIISSANNQGGTNAWGALTSEQKIREIDAVIKREVPKGVEALMGSSAR